ncbi:MFS transporter [Nonomuraea endophytica]|uniref:MFS family permease n=1 Tax=Nonomuraea endophytica TaxID=714136 RepID=A0A7W8AB77_9ACTN|nr:MFS transporter [Nonomuraea endophytica]MBB5083072.1 MFS family permease [Nonomuraea endophytica]
MSRIVPPPGPARTLALAQLTNSLGDGAFYASSALFFTRVVGLSAAQVGVALTVAWACGMLAGVPLGHVADRWGPRRTAVVLAVATALALSAFLVVRAYPLFILVACLYACCQGGLTSARQALLAGLVPPEERTAVRAHLQSTLNAGLAVGAGIGGLALSFDTAPAYLTVFALDAMAFLLAALMLRRLPEIQPTPATPAGSREPSLAVLRDRPYALITFLNAIMYLNMPLLSLGLPLWIVERTEAPKPVAAALLMVNMLSVVIFQVRVARQVTDLPSAAKVAARSGWIFLAACLVYAVSGAHIAPWVAVAVLVAAALIQVFGEMMQGAAAWELGFTLAPADKQGQYQGFFGMGPQIARMLGPVLMTTLLIGWGTAGWLVLGALFLTAGLAMGPAVRHAQRTRETLTPHP